MERRSILFGLLVFLFVSDVICEPGKRGGGWGWKSSSRGSSSRGNSRPSSTRQSQTYQSQSHTNQAQRGQEYRNWATKLTGAGGGNRKPVSNVNRGNVRQGSQPGKIGWNVPQSNPPPKPSAPKQDHIQKTSATSVHSGYPNTGNAYNNQARPPPYSPPGSQPSYGGGYNTYGGHNPGYGHGGYGGGYPSYGGGSHGYPMGQHGFSSVPGSGYNPTIASPQPVILQSKPYKPGIGQIAKEAFVFAGVNAAVNRIIPGGIYGHGGSVWGGGSGSSSGGGGGGGAAAAGGAVPGVTNTHITYNNYYNNGTSSDASGTAPAGAAPVQPVQNVPSSQAQPDNANPPPAQSPPQQGDNNNNNQNNQNNGPPNVPSPSGYVITDSDLQKLSEDLYSKEKNNAYKDITMNLQGHKTDESTTDDAPEPFLTVKPEAYELPTIKKVLALHDNYELDVKKKEEMTSEERKEESELLDAFLETDVLSTAMKYLAGKGYIENDEYEFKDSLKRIWFSQFKRIDGEPSSSGFETVFLAEQFDSEIIGLHNWIYFAKQEEQKNLNYLGYIKKTDLGSNGAVVKLRLKLNDVIQPLTTVFIGTSPELEMALYTLCFYIRPNSICPVSLGGTQFMVVANRVNYFGKDIIVSAFPEL